MEFDAETWALLETLRLQLEKELGHAVSLGEVGRESVRVRALGSSAGAAGPETGSNQDYAEVWAAAEIVRFEELKAEVEANPGKEGSRYLARAHQRIVAALSGNRCTFPGCTGLAVEWHHVDPVGEGGAADAANHAPVCLRHHEGAHTGWIEDHRGPVKDWRYVRPGGERRSRGVDRQWQGRGGTSGGGR